MTVSEAYYVVFDIVVSELANDCRGQFHHPISALKGYDIAQVCTALNLTVANHFLLYSESDAYDRATGEKKFSEYVEWCSVGTLLQMAVFAADNEVDIPVAKPVFEFDDPRLLAQERPSSFAEFCRHLGADNPRYWQDVYERLELKYTSASPRGNDVQLPECDLDDSGIRDHFLSIVSTISDLEVDAPPHIGDCSNLPYTKKTILYAIRWLMDHYATVCKTADDRAIIDHCDKLNSSLSWLLTRVARDWQQIEPADKDAIAKLNTCKSFPDWALPLKAKYINEDAASNEAFDVAYEVTRDRVALEKKYARVPGGVSATDDQIARPHTADDGFAPRVPWIVGVHYIVALLVMWLGGFALHVWTARLFFTNWGTIPAIVAFLSPYFAELVAILLVCFWWGPWFYILAIASWVTAVSSIGSLSEAKDAANSHRMSGAVALAMYVFLLSFSFCAVRAATTPKVVSDSEREEIADTTREEIIDFIESDRFIEAAQLGIEAAEEWDHLMFNFSAFTPSEGKEYVAKLEVKFAKAYDKQGELIPPKCLRSNWDKQVKVMQLYFQACGLLNSKLVGKSTIDSQQLTDEMNALIYKANDLKTEAGQEMVDICSEYDIDIVGSEAKQ